MKSLVKILQSSKVTPIWILSPIFSTQVGSCLLTSEHTHMPKIMVDRVCTNLEIRVLDDHHIQALSLKVLLLPSKIFTRSASKMAQKMIRQQ